MLKAGYMEAWVYRDTLSGVPQGGIVCPILSNIYLDKLDEFVELVQVNIAEGRADYSALRHAAKRVAVNPGFHVPGLEHVADKAQEPLIPGFFSVGRAAVRERGETLVVA